ncbi:hypothetical protein [Fischerella sp. JS2]|uniref:hypothetical protein n=1 Tax=Fischerella sp. JS2 TaxID=2597771 RepID=UPI0028ED42A2|nr:hypothetical protein [Fischerella sp. JS2]
MAHRILTAVYHMLLTPQPYQDLRVNYRLAAPKKASAQTYAFSSGTAFLAIPNAQYPFPLKNASDRYGAQQLN